MTPHLHHPDHAPPNCSALLAAGAPPVLLDCSFDLADTAAGERACARRPPARRAVRSTSTATCPAPRPAANGRHPLPDARSLRRHAGRAGHHAGDAGGGATTARAAPYAARAVVDAALAGPRGGGRARRRPRRLAAPPAARSTPTRRRRRAAAALPATRRRCAAPIDADALAAPARPRAPGRRARRRALPRRGRAAGPGGRPHSRRAEPLLQGQPRRRRPLQAGGAAARRVRRAARPRRAGAAWCTSAAPASPPATTCWRWKMPAWPARALYPGSWSEWCGRPGAARGARG